MRDVRAIEALALLDEALGPDHFFGWDQRHGLVEDVVVQSVREPLVVDARQAVARTEDHVDEELAVVGLAEPVGECGFGGVPSSRERVQRGLEVLLANEDVEIFGMAFDARVARKRIRPADQYGDMRMVEDAQRMAVELLGLGVEDFILALALGDGGHPGGGV
jgi:hypothetical protein